MKNLHIAVFAATLCSTVAQADMLTFSCITNNASSACSTGENQLLAEVSALGESQVQFTFYNTGPFRSSLEGIYFDDAKDRNIAAIDSLIDADEGIGGHSNVDFTAVHNVKPKNLPGAKLISPAFKTTKKLLADADTPAWNKGVNPGEWLGMVANLASGKTIEDLFFDLNNGDFRIGLHVIDFPGDYSESFVNNPTIVPIPAAGWLLLSGLAGLAGLNRKRLSQQ